MISYEYTNLDEFEPDRGGPTPELTWTVNGKVLTFDVDTHGVDLDNDLEEKYKEATKSDVLAFLASRVKKLETELTKAKVVLEAATETTTFVNHANQDEDN